MSGMPILPPRHVATLNAPQPRQSVPLNHDRSNVVLGMPLARNSHRVVAGSGTNPPGARGQSMSRDYSGQDSGPSEARLNAWTGPNGNHAGPLENWTTMDNNDYDRRLPPPPSPVITAHAASSGEDEAAFSSSWEVSATADSGPVLPNDLQALVVKDFNLSWASQSTCTGFATLLENTPGMSQVVASPLLYLLGAILRVQENMASIQLNVPRADDMTQMFARINTRLADTATVLSETQSKTIRAIAGKLIYNPACYIFDVVEAVMDVLRANKSEYGLTDHFSIGKERRLRGDTGKLVSSVLGGFREDIYKSLGFVVAGKGKRSSLARFALACQKKYGSESAGTPGYPHVARYALLRHFARNHPGLAPANPDNTKKRGKKRTRSEAEDDYDGQSSESSQAEQASSQLTVFVPGSTIMDVNGNPFQVPDHPPKFHFWRVFEWHITVLQLKLGDDMGTLGWEEYVNGIITEDRTEFPPADGAYVPGLSSIIDDIMGTGTPGPVAGAQSAGAEAAAATVVPSVDYSLAFAPHASASNSN